MSTLKLYQSSTLDYSLQIEQHLAICSECGNKKEQAKDEITRWYSWNPQVNSILHYRLRVVENRR